MNQHANPSQKKEISARNGRTPAAWTGGPHGILEAGFGHHIALRCGAGVLQPKLTINQPGDVYEQEADRVADQVVRMGDNNSSLVAPVSAAKVGGTLQRKCTCGGDPGPTGECAECGKKRLQRKALDPESGARGDAAAPPIVHEVLRSPGQPLDAATRAFMEPRFGHDFGHVRIHADASAAESADSVNSHAYTVGNHVVFGAGAFAPQSAPGSTLLAHELAHVLQQGAVPPAPDLKLGDPQSHWEREAERIGSATLTENEFVSQAAVSKAPAGLIQRNIAPTPPGYKPVEGKRLGTPEIWKPANNAIEEAYREDHSSNPSDILTGRDFEQGGRPGSELSTGLPKGAANGKIANRFLGRFKGISRQLTPDIIDFGKGAIYEIKGTSKKGIVQGLIQLQGYYKVAEAIQNEVDPNRRLPRFDQINATWKPRPVLTAAGGLLISTLATTMTSALPVKVKSMDGLILYEVFEPGKDPKDEKPKEPDKKDKAKPKPKGGPKFGIGIAINPDPGTDSKAGFGVSVVISSGGKSYGAGGATVLYDSHGNVVGAVGATAATGSTANSAGAVGASTGQNAHVTSGLTAGLGQAKDNTAKGLATASQGDTEGGETKAIATAVKGSTKDPSGTHIAEKSSNSEAGNLSGTGKSTGESQKDESPEFAAAQKEAQRIEAELAAANANQAEFLRWWASHSPGQPRTVPSAEWMRNFMLATKDLTPEQVAQLKKVNWSPAPGLTLEQMQQRLRSALATNGQAGAKSPAGQKAEVLGQAEPSKEKLPPPVDQALKGAEGDPADAALDGQSENKAASTPPPTSPDKASAPSPAPEKKKRKKPSEKDPTADAYLIEMKKRLKEWEWSQLAAGGSVIEFDPKVDTTKPFRADFYCKAADGKGRAVAVVSALIKSTGTGRKYFIILQSGVIVTSAGQQVSGAELAGKSF